MIRPDNTLLAATLGAAVHDVIGVSYACPLTPEGAEIAQAELPANLSPCATTLPLEIAASSYSLRLVAAPAVAVRWLACMLGREPSAQETVELAASVLDEALNQIGGRFAGLLGEVGVEVELGTPRESQKSPAAHWQLWSCDGHPLAIALHAGRDNA